MARLRVPWLGAGISDLYRPHSSRNLVLWLLEAIRGREIFANFWNLEVDTQKIVHRAGLNLCPREPARESLLSDSHNARSNFLCLIQAYKGIPHLVWCEYSQVAAKCVIDLGVNIES